MKCPTFIDSLAANASDDDHLYLINEPADGGPVQSWSFSAWVHRVAALCTQLEAQCPTSPNDLAVLRAPNTPTTLALMFALWARGVTVAPVDPSVSLADLKATARDMAARLILVPQDEMDALRRIADDGLTGLIALEAFETGPQAPAAALTHTTFRTGLPISRDLIRVATSGTTGAPKIIPLTEGNVLASVHAMAQAFGWTSRTRTLNVLPINHVHGLLINCLIPWFMRGSVVLCDRFRASRFWSTVVRHDVSDVSLVPAIFERLMARPPADDPQTLPLQQCFAGSAPLRPALLTQFEQRFGIPIRQHWGLSEATCVASVIPPQREHYQVGDDLTRSVGLAIEHTDIAIMARDGEALLAEGAVGEIVVRGPTVIRGYLRTSPTGVQTDRSAFQGDWFRTGDLGYQRHDPHGRPWLFVVGRSKDMLIRGGLNLFPQRIDDVVGTWPGMGKFATIGFPNRWYGEEVAVVIDPDNPLDEDAFLDWLEQQLGHEAAPKVVLRLADIPETRTGKIMRMQLAARLQEELAALEAVQYRRRLA